VRAFVTASRWDPGFDRSRVSVSFVVAPTDIYTTTGAAVEMLRRTRDEIAAIPGVESVGLASAGPLFGGVETGSLSVAGAAPVADAPPVHWFDVDEHFFDTIGMRLRQGRGFAASDRAGAPQVAVVNDTLVRRYFPDGRAIGRRVTVMDHASEIVGVVDDVTPARRDQPAAAEIYWPIQQYRRYAAYLVVRTAPGAAAPEPAMRARIAAVEPAAQASPLQSLDAIFTRSLVSPRFNAALVAAFALVALALAAIGVAGLVAFMVASRTREIGLRMALGASPQQLVRRFVRYGLALAAGGMAIGGVAAWWLGASLQSMLHGVPGRDPLTFAVTLGAFATVAALASWLPARRASRIDPLAALRAE
jgi:predicted permease